MAQDYVRQQFDTPTLTGWTAGSWEVLANAMERTSWVSPDVLPDVAFYETGIGKGNAEIKGNVWVDNTGEVGLQVLTAASGINGYEFRLNRSGTSPVVEIWKIIEDAYTLLASAAAATLTADKWVRLVGRLETLDKENWSSGVKLSLYMDDDDTALLSYSDRLQPTPRGSGYMGIRAVSTTGVVIKVDDVTIRRLMDVEVPNKFEAPVWSWGRLATHGLLRLEGGGNPQISRSLMLDYLAWAEEEIAQKGAEPYWLDRVYELTTSSRLNDLPPWIARIKGAFITGQSTPIKIIPRSEHNIKNAARNKSGTINTMVFLGVTDDGSMQYEFYPEPTGPTAITLYCVARAGVIADENQIPLVPHEHIEVLVFGALRRAFRSDANREAIKDNDQMWAEGIRAIMRDHQRKVNEGRRMIPENEYNKNGSVWGGQWWRDPANIPPYK